MTQKLADRFVDQNWPKILHRLVRQANPLMKHPWFRSFRYYWVVDQAEFSTDLIFTDRKTFAFLACYARLLAKFSRHGHRTSGVSDRPPRAD